jgi:hypothetical protein
MSSTKRPRKHLDRKDKYVGLPHWLLTCQAWKALPLAAKALYLEGLELRFNGCNNGDVRLSAAKRPTSSARLAAGNALTHTRPRCSPR